jgi:putative transcriptional regulator
MAEEEKLYLTGKLLLSMPSMGDPRFKKSVIYICVHDENGAMGIVVNDVIDGLDFSEVLEQLGITGESESTKKLLGLPILNGGPVETARGIMLHSRDFKRDDTVEIENGLSITGTIDALKEISEGHMPENMVFALGYAGWGAGQLEDEIQQNAWLVLDSGDDIVFSATAGEMWGEAIARLGIDPALLSSDGGRA